MLRLQKGIGNRAVGQVLARAPKDQGTVRVTGLPPIKITGGNIAEWMGKGSPDYLEITSAKGRHSPKLEKLATGRGREDVKVESPLMSDDGEYLDTGTLVIEFTKTRIKKYSVDGNTETWRVTDWDGAHRTKTTHRIGH